MWSQHTLPMWAELQLCSILCIPGLHLPLWSFMLVWSLFYAHLGEYAFFLLTAVILSSMKENFSETVILCPYVTFVVMFRIISPKDQRLLPKFSSLFLSVPCAFLSPLSSILCSFQPSSLLSTWNLSLFWYLYLLSPNEISYLSQYAIYKPTRLVVI